MGRSTVYDRREADEDFAASMTAALDDACDALELEARRRAKDGVTKPIFGSGGTGVGSVQVGEVQEYSDTLMIFLLKAHRPEKYRERYEVQHKGGVQLQLVEEIVDAEHRPANDPPPPRPAGVPPK